MSPTVSLRGIFESLLIWPLESTNWMFQHGKIHNFMMHVLLCGLLFFISVQTFTMATFMRIECIVNRPCTIYETVLVLFVCLTIVILCVARV